MNETLSVALIVLNIICGAQNFRHAITAINERDFGVALLALFGVALSVGVITYCAVSLGGVR